MQVYTPIWLKIKQSCDISHAPMHVFEPISKCQKLLSKVRDIVTLAVWNAILMALIQSPFYMQCFQAQMKILKNLHGEEFCAAERKKL